MKGELVIGAIAGDILGSPYERNAIYNPDVDLTDEQDFTDDSILTIATMECMLDDYEEFEKYYMKWVKISSNGYMREIVRQLIIHGEMDV